MIHAHRLLDQAAVLARECNSTTVKVSLTAIFGRPPIFGIVAIIGVLVGCTSIERRAAIAEMSPTEVKKLEPLDVRFSYVSIRNVHMTQALLFLSQVISQSSTEIPRFSWSIDVGPPALKPPAYRDPLVNLETSNASLRMVVDKLCAQAGWTYNEVLEKQWVPFHPASK
jgi:hypothetical protein